MGAIYALVALGFTLIWNAVGVVNFAQGEVVMVGAFVSVAWFINMWHLPWPLTLLGTIAAMALFGVIMATGLYHPLRNAPQLATIVSTLGLSIFLKNVAVLIWGPHPLSTPGPFKNSTISVGSGTIYAQQILIMGFLVVLMVVQVILLTRTQFGRAMRATAQDREVARLMGVRTELVIIGIFAYACVLAGIAGLLLAPLFYVSAGMGGVLALKAFAASIIGGFGSEVGAIAGGLTLGVVEGLGSFYLPPSYIDVLAFGLLIVFLLVRPQGIFGEPIMDRP
jgi:branched-chain amino acid transport system permease protein